MINAIKMWFAGVEKPIELIVGADGVNKIFFDKEKPGSTVVVLHEDGIVEYGGVLRYIASKDYHKENPQG